jgi:hypothetical protein
VSSTFYDASTSFYGINPLWGINLILWHQPISKASTFRFCPWGIHPRARSLSLWHQPLFMRHRPLITTLEAWTLGIVLRSWFVMQVCQHNLYFSMLCASTLLGPCVPTMCFCTTYSCVHDMSHANHPISCLSTTLFPFMRYILLFYSLCSSPRLASSISIHSLSFLHYIHTF